jgi:hypothetical protein
VESTIIGHIQATNGIRGSLSLYEEKEERQRNREKDFHNPIKPHW